MSLYAELSKISENIKSHRDAMNKSEAATEQVSVMPFLGALGYDTFNPAEVRKQFPILNTDALDFAILRDDAPVIFVEAKSAGNKLRAKEWKQLFQYFNAEIGLRFGILTNGIQYRFYTDLGADNIMDKEPFMTIDMLNLDKRLVAELDSFSKTGFDPERVVASARKRVLSRLLREEMNNPTDEIARYFAKQLTSARLTSDQLSYYAGLVREAWCELVEPPVTVPPPPPPPDTEYIPIYGYYEGHRFEAELLRNTMDRGLQIGRHHIRYNGKTTWLKNAAVMAIRSVDPSFQPSRTNPNGFKFWHVADPADGKEHMIRSISGWDNISDEALRQRVLSS